jgi:hypothetical protein
MCLAISATPDFIDEKEPNHCHTFDFLKNSAGLDSLSTVFKAASDVSLELTNHAETNLLT